MSNEVKKYTITIFGQTYTLVSDEPEPYIMQAAQEVDALMHSIAAKTAGASREKVAIFVALRCALDALVLKKSLNTDSAAVKKMVALMNDVLHQPGL